jgi:Zn-dependent peptidase ImmA (M78 family)
MGVSNRGYKVAPRSTKNIEDVAEKTRQLLIEHQLVDAAGKVDAAGVLEFLLPRCGYTYCIGCCDEMGNNEAYVKPDEKLIVIKEDVYEKLQLNDGRARFTILHELGHIILQHSATFHRDGDGSHQTFEDSEWQANTFASFVLMPIEICRSVTSVNELVMSCGVSLTAAEVGLSRVKKPLSN